jgi:hypothetical protein
VKGEKGRGKRGKCNIASAFCFSPLSLHPSPFTLLPSPFTLHSSLFTLLFLGLRSWTIQKTGPGNDCSVGGPKKRPWPLVAIKRYGTCVHVSNSMHDSWITLWIGTKRRIVSDKTPKSSEKVGSDRTKARQHGRRMRTSTLRNRTARLAPEN